MKRYLCIGGGLDGRRVTSDELRPERRSIGPTPLTPNRPPKGTVIDPGGLFGELAGEYVDYNCASRGSGPSMVRIHRSLLP